VIALGTFDGFHRGHQKVITDAGVVADELNAPLAVLTTEPHPRLYFKPDQEPFLLTPFRAKARHLENFGVDILFAIHFDKQLATTSAEDFIEKILVGQMGVRHVFIGFNYHFGQGRRGDAAMLQAYGERLDFGVTVVEPVSIGVEGSAGKTYSSTLIRDTLRAGHARRAAALLGHWWMIEGHVIKGDQRGRTIGFPTLNLPMGDYVQPKLGVYAVRVTLEDGRIIEGVANIGRRPTFDKTEVLLEAHLFDFNEDLYGKLISVALVAFIRGEQKFSGLDELKAHIEKDEAAARLLLKDPDNAQDRFPEPKRT
ncbi:MAG: bifunctional riboflavin kinase/FAD synthetase, partial [Sphingomonadales bacterium]